MRTHFPGRTGRFSVFFFIAFLAACGGSSGGGTATNTDGTVPNTSPVADAGVDQSADEGTLVTLDGSASSDTDGDALDFSWSQTDGPTVTLSDSTVAGPTFTAPGVADGTSLTFSLTVDDGEATADDTVTVTINDVSAPTVAITSPTEGEVLENTKAFTLGGSVSDNSDIVALVVSIDGVDTDLSLDGDTFTADLEFTGASADITVTATDAAGNEGSASVSVSLLDTMAPELTVNWPATKLGIDVPYEYTLSGSVADLSSIDAVTVTIDGVDNSVDLVDGVFSTTVTMSGQADELTVSVTDPGGLSASESNTAMQLAAGELDTTFNSTGYNPLALSNNGQFNEVAIDSQGRILAFGWQPNSNFDFVLARYTTEGLLDTTFGGTGYVIVDDVAGGNDRDYGQGLVIDGNDDIYVIGNSNSGASYDLGVAKVTSAGVLDTSFGGGDGLFSHNLGSQDEPLRTVLDADGNLVIVGNSDSPGNRDMVIWRVLADGSSLDTTFAGGDGYVIDTAAAGTGVDKGLSVVIDDQGRYLVSGYKGNEGVIWRYLANGDIDTSFGGGDGVVLLQPSGYQGVQFHDIELTADGKILVSGRLNDNVLVETFNYLVARYTADGVLDTTFGEDADGDDTPDGYTMWNSPSSDVDQGRELVQDVAGNIVMAGFSWDADGGSDGRIYMTVLRFTPDGLIDTTFGSDYDTDGEPDGWFAHRGAAGANKNDYGYGIAIDADGKLLVVGQSDAVSTGADQVIWRIR